MARRVCLPFVLLSGAAVVRAAQETEEAKSALVAAQSVNAFCADLLKEVASSGGNQLFSPHSIATALAMARVGANGNTASELDAVLHLPPDAAAAFRDLAKSLDDVPMEKEHGPDGGKSSAPAYTLSIANGLFAQRGWRLKTAFRTKLHDSHAAEFLEVDFQHDPAAARKTINDWVAEKTAQRIKDIVPPDLPTPDTRLALANAIHFKARWLEAFSESNTIDAPFFANGDREITCRRMRRTDDYAFAETPDAWVVELPYRGNATSMVVVLPKAKDGLDALVKGLTPDGLAALTSGLARRRVAVELPKFQFEVALELMPRLEAMGIHDAFSAERADFTGISEEEPLFLGAVLHKAFVAVDEHGIEAAAATVVLVRAGSARPVDEPTPFVVDHPFLFLLRHRPSGTILFAGRVVDPTKS